MRKTVPALAAAFMASSGVAMAESVEAMCVRVSNEWGTVGDILSQCSCLADRAAGDAALEKELRSLGDDYSSDDEAYDGASAKAKAAFDACSVNS